MATPFFMLKRNNKNVYSCLIKYVDTNLKEVMNSYV